MRQTSRTHIDLKRTIRCLHQPLALGLTLTLMLALRRLRHHLTHGRASNMVQVLGQRLQNQHRRQQNVWKVVSCGPLECWRWSCEGFNLGWLYSHTLLSRNIPQSSMHIPRSFFKLMSKTLSSVSRTTLTAIVNKLAIIYLLNKKFFYTHNKILS